MFLASALVAVLLQAAWSTAPVDPARHLSRPDVLKR